MPHLSKKTEMHPSEHSPYAEQAFVVQPLSKHAVPAPLRPAGYCPQPQGFLSTKRQAFERIARGWRL